jgi:hypothetical protein
MATVQHVSPTFRWVGHSLWMDKHNGAFPPPLMRRQCVGNYVKTKKGTYWAIQFYMGNIRTAVPTEQEAKDLLMLLARTHYGN